LINSSNRTTLQFTICYLSKNKKSSRNMSWRSRSRKTRRRCNRKKLKQKLWLNRTQPKVPLQLFQSRKKTQSKSTLWFQTSLNNILPNRKRSLPLKKNLRLQLRILPPPRALKSRIWPTQLRKQRPNLLSLLLNQQLFLPQLLRPSRKSKSNKWYRA